MKIFFLFLSLVAFCFIGHAQENPVTWTIEQKTVENGTIELRFVGVIASDYYIYGIVEMDGPLPTILTADASSNFELVGGLAEGIPAKKKFDEAFEIEVQYYEGEVVLIQKIKRLTEKTFTINGVLEYQSCSGMQCIPNEHQFSITIAGGAVATATNEEKTENESFWWFLLLAIGAGLGAILTPCVFPMIPMTVSFFMQGSGNKAQTIIKAIIFWLSVGLIYGAVGCVVAIFKNPAIATIVSSSWYMNLIFASMFIVFAMSFLGMFEITLPTGLANKADRQADKGGYLASFFMAVALAIVSFSCTGPFVGGLLPEAAAGVSKLKPIIGLTGFGLAMASPFLIMAIFPALLNKLKSGSWLNSVKVVFAFIMLGFCVKFLNQVDVDAQLNIITRDVAIAFWIVLSILLGFYILGKIKFSHDSDVKYVSVPRMFFAIIAFVFAVYLIPGLFGADLNAVSAFLPAKDKQQFDLTLVQQTNNTTTATSHKETPCGNIPKYSETKMHTPSGINGYFDLQEALDCAKQLNRPVLVDITGFGCTNCKQMEASTFKDSRIIELMNTEFVWVSLYYDDKTKLPADEQTAKIKNVGQKNQNYQQTAFAKVGGPYFAILDENGNILEKDLGKCGVNEFLEFAQKGLNKFRNNK